jgi:hypothetical protein
MKSQMFLEHLTVICISRAYEQFDCWGCSGKIFPSGVAADSAIEKLSQEANRGGDGCDVTEPPS